MSNADSTGEAALILVVEDDEAHRYILRTWLQRAGHTVLETSDGTAALSLLADRSATGDPLPELALIDVHLPDMSGFEVCERIKAGPRTGAIPVVHVSATAIATADRTQGLERGADAYLTEPIAPTELQATVVATLRYSRARVRAEGLARRMRLLHEATMRIHTALGPEEPTEVAVRAVHALFGTYAVAAIQPPDGSGLRLTVFGGDIAKPIAIDAPAGLSDELAELVAPLPSAGTGLARLTAEQSPAALFPEHRRTSLTIAASRLEPGEPVTYLAADLTAGNEEDGTLLTRLAQACAVARRAQAARQQLETLSGVFHRALLPAESEFDGHAGVEIAIQPRPEEPGHDGSGNGEPGFCDVLETPAGLLLAVGRVATGPDWESAVATAGLRHALAACAADGRPLPDLLERLDESTRRLWPERTVELSLALITPDRDLVHVAAAGTPEQTRPLYPGAEVVLAAGKGPDQGSVALVARIR